MQLAIVPAWRRPEFLWACLQRLRAADRPGVRYLISLDRGHSYEVAGVANQFRRQLSPGRVTIVHRRHSHKGNSFNVLESYRDALAHKVDLVHLIEEDIFVGADYFDYAWQAHAMLPDVFAVSGCRNQAYPVGIEPPADPTAVYQHPSYQSLAVSFRPPMIDRFVAHARISYYKHPQAYCQSTFPASGIPPGHCEQDGLINRVRESIQGVAVYPGVPRAYHAGFYGYNRHGGWLDPADGSLRRLEQRGAALLAMSADVLNGRARHYKDHTTTPLNEHRPAVTHTIRWPE